GGHLLGLAGGAEPGRSDPVEERAEPDVVAHGPGVPAVGYHGGEGAPETVRRLLAEEAKGGEDDIGGGGRGGVRPDEAELGGQLGPVVEHAGEGDGQPG